jgi:hypothetical protein
MSFLLWERKRSDRFQDPTGLFVKTRGWGLAVSPSYRSLCRGYLRARGPSAQLPQLSAMCCR